MSRVRVVRAPWEGAGWGGSMAGGWGVGVRRYQHMRFKLRLTFISRTIAQINALRLADSIGGGALGLYMVYCEWVLGNVLQYMSFWNLIYLI